MIIHMAHLSEHLKFFLAHNHLVHHNVSFDFYKIVDNLLINNLKETLIVDFCDLFMVSILKYFNVFLK